MPIFLRIHRQFSSRVNRTRLAHIAQRALRAEHARGAVTIVVTTDRAIRALNRQFHATDAATDVLAFPSLHAGGDIVISYETARGNARRVGWRIADELELLVVHGILHLLGYDDHSPRARARMWKRQAEILGRVIPEMQARGQGSGAQG